MDYCVNNGLISIHAPAKGATVAHRAYPPMLSFQSTLPRRERRIPPQKFENLSVDFNPRSREGSDLVSKTNFFLPEKFQSTLPRRERQQPNPIIVFIEDFNPRSREGSDLLIKYSVLNSMDFNPRSREGSDSCSSCLSPHAFISIHAPAKGATDLVLDLSRSIFISIHAPAKGATEEKGFIPLRDMEFQSTLPRRERHPPFLALSTMTRFQSTLPRRERLPFGETGKGILNFNPRSREGSDLSSIHRQSRSR